MQTTLQIFERQHARALRCVSSIEAIIANDSVVSRASDIRLLMAEMSGVLKPHLALEDRLLYPQLGLLKKSNVSEVASKFWNEMQAMTPVIIDFLTKWRAANSIEFNQEVFKNESLNIFSALRTRIKAEEEDLYPLFGQSAAI